jgi:hypothetical protein
LASRLGLDKEKEPLYGPYDGFLKGEFSVLARRRAAAVGIAIAMFEADHGRAIKDLAELVPNYLPAVPDDPFVDPPQPLGYQPQEPARVYSVGPDGVDEGGLDAVGAASKGMWTRTTVPDDVVFYLHGRPPEPVRPPQTQSDPEELQLGDPPPEDSSSSF